MSTLWILTTTIVNVGILIANVGILWIDIKLYTEILKIGHIRNIGQVRKGD